MVNFDWIDMTVKMNEVRLFSRTLVHRYGYVTKKPDIHDKRSYSVCITEAGRKELQKIYELYLSPIYKLRKKLGDEEFFKLISSIEKANKIMNEE